MLQYRRGKGEQHFEISQKSVSKVKLPRKRENF